MVSQAITALYRFRITVLKGPRDSEQKDALPGQVENLHTGCNDNKTLERTDIFKSVGNSYSG